MQVNNTSDLHTVVNHIVGKLLLYTLHTDVSTEAGEYQKSLLGQNLQI